MAPDRPDAAGAAGPSDQSIVVHATTVAIGDRAVLIRGPSGSGKSGLALQLMAMGATLVADDRTQVRRAGDSLVADAPEAIRGRIEARFVGILAVPPRGPVPLALVVEMGETEPERLPPRREAEILGLALPLVRKTDQPHFPAAIRLYLVADRVE